MPTLTDKEQFFNDVPQTEERPAITLDDALYAAKQNMDVINKIRRFCEDEAVSAYQESEKQKSDEHKSIALTEARIYTRIKTLIDILL